MRHLFIFVENLCQNALDLTNDEHILIIQDNWPLGTYCQWLISAKDEVEGYVTLEFDIKVGLNSFNQSFYQIVIDY